MEVYSNLHEELRLSKSEGSLTPGAYVIFEKMSHAVVKNLKLENAKKEFCRKACLEAASKFWDRFDVDKNSNAQVYYFTVMKSALAGAWKKCVNELDPMKVYQQNKTRLDLRQYTREFMKVKPYRKDVFEAGQIYYVYYPVKENLTDKWHNIAVVYCLGRYIDVNGISRARCINMLYMPTYEQLKMLQEGYTVLQKSKNVNQLVYGTVMMHERLQVGQFQCAIKDFTEGQVSFCRKVNREDWGMLPLLKKELFGNLSYSGLQESFNAECKKPIVIVTKKDKKKKPPIVNEEKFDEDEENEDPIDYENIPDYDATFKVETQHFDDI